METTRRLVAAMREGQLRPQMLINASAVGYYGPAEERRTEADSPGSGFPGSVCQAWEAEADQAASLGIRVVKLRLGLVLGKGGVLTRMILPYRLYLGGPIGSGEQWVSWIHLHDVIQAIAYIMNTCALEGAVT